MGTLFGSPSPPAPKPDSFRNRGHQGTILTSGLSAGPPRGAGTPRPPEPDLPGLDQPSMAGLLDNLTGEDHGTLRRMADGARQRTDHSERARAETGMFLSIFRERDARGADQFLETFKTRAGGREAGRIRQIADFQAARERQAAQPQPAQAAPAKPQPQPQPAQAAPAKPQPPQPAPQRPAQPPPTRSTKAAQPSTTAETVTNPASQKGTAAVRKAGPPTNQVIDLDDYYRRLGFDPDGPGQISEALRSPMDMAKARRFFGEAQRRGLELFQAGVLSREERNVYQHAWWSYQMTLSTGADTAKELGDAHERSSVDINNGERLKDLYNNNVGRELALDPANRNRDAEDVIIEAIFNRKMQNTPFRVFQPPGAFRLRRRP